jgi:hypothetical protein
MADSWSTDEKHAAAEAEQADIAANVVPDAEQAPEPVAPVQGETVDQPDAASSPDADDLVEVKLSEDYTADYVNAETGEVTQEPVVEVSVAGVVLHPGDPVEVTRAVALSVADEDTIEIVEAA